MRDQGSEERLWLLPVAGGTAALLLVAELLGRPHGVSVALVFQDYCWKALRLLPTLLQLGLVGLLVRALLQRSSSPIQAALQPIRTRLSSPWVALATLAPLALMPLLFSGFGLLKMLMPLASPFAWDDAFAAADRLLFFGHQPWQLSHALFGGAGATLFIDRAYTVWIALLSAAIVGFALFAPRYDRARFFLSFSAAWILLGVIGAYLGSSAGPCYAALVGAVSAPEFAPLAERLAAIQTTEGVKLGALEWQAVLWKAHAARDYSFGMGISAMPSLHNAIAVLYALALFRFGRPAGIAASLYALLIFVGSVHLGWHYAVDGIIAAAAMIAIWWAAGRYLKACGYEAALARAVEPARSPGATPALA